MATIFVSYAREDQAFVRDLYTSLQGHGHEVWVDWEGIPPSADYFAEIERAIDSADAVVVVISPELAASRVCGQELQHALDANKRLIPILRRGTRSATVNDALRRLNWIDFQAGVDQEAALRTLLAAIETDLDWVTEHTSLLVRVVEWEALGRDSSLLLSGRALREAEEWIAGADLDKDPQPTQGQRQFILASRRAASNRQRRLIGAATAAVIVSLALAVLAFLQRETAIDQRGVAVAQRQEAEAQRQEADKQRQAAETQRQEADTQRQEAEHQRNIAQDEEAKARSRALAANALAMLGTDPELSVRLAVEAYKVAPTSEAETALRESLGASHVRDVFAGHTAWVSNVEFSRDGARLYSSGFDGLVRAWSVTARSAEWSTANTGSPVITFAISPDQQTIAGAVADGTVRLWRADTGAGIAQVRYGAGIPWSVAFSPDGTLLAAVGDDGTLHVWNLATRESLLTVDGKHQALNFVDFSPNGDRIAAGSEDGTVLVWSVPDGKQIHALIPANREQEQFTNAYAINHVRFSPDGRTIAASSYDGMTRLWNDSTGVLDHELVNPTYLFTIRPSVLDVVFSPDGKTVATSSIDGAVRLWDATTGLRETDLRGLLDLSTNVVFSPDGTRIAASSHDGTARVWDVGSGAVTAVLAGHTDFVEAIAFDPSGERVVTGGRDGTVRVWESDTGAIAQVYGTDPGGGFTAAFTSDGRVLTADFSGTTSEYHADTGKPLSAKVSYDPGRLASWWSGAFSPDRTMLAASDLITNNVNVWDPLTGKTIAVFSGHTDTVNGIAWSPNGELLATVSEDKTVRVWNLRSQRQVFLGQGEQGMGSVTFSPDGATIATGDNYGLIQLWDAATGKEKGELQIVSEPIVYSLAFSPDGTELAAGGGDNVAWIWDLAQQRPIRELRGHTIFVTAIAFTPDGKQLVTGDWYGEMRIWDATSGQQLAELHGHRSTVRSIAISPDGSELLTAAYSDPTRMTACDVCGSVDHLLAVAEGRGTRQLTTDERRRFQVDGDIPAGASPEAASPVALPDATPIEALSPIAAPAATPVASPVG